MGSEVVGVCVGWEVVGTFEGEVVGFEVVGICVGREVVGLLEG